MSNLTVQVVRTDSHLCIGGPWDGMRYAPKRGEEKYFVIHERPTMFVADYDMTVTGRPMPVDMPKRHVYVRQLLCGIGVYVPEGQKPEDTLFRLLAGYKP